MFVSGPLATRGAALFTDLYEITMAASYLREGMNGLATFSLFARKLPEERSFLVATGLEGAPAGRPRRSGDHRRETSAEDSSTPSITQSGSPA